MASFMPIRLTQLTFLIFPGNLYKSHSSAEFLRCLYCFNITFSILFALLCTFAIAFTAFIISIRDLLQPICTKNSNISIPTKTRGNLITTSFIFSYIRRINKEEKH